MRLIAGPSQPLLPELREASRRHRGGRLQLAAAWANEEGAGLLRDATLPEIETVDAIIGINNDGTTVEGLLRLLSFVGSLKVLYKHPFVTFHPKAYCFDDGAAGSLLMGSSNLTAGGLDTNFEASVLLPLTPDLRTQWHRYWNSLVGHPFCFEIATSDDVERLYKGGYVSLESAVRKQRHRRLTRRLRVMEGEDQREFDLPTEGSTRRFSGSPEPIKIPFETIDEEQGGREFPGLVTSTQPPELARENGEPIFVRTLTANDVAKLHGEQSGTFEPDLGLGARDENPEFWGWPNQFQTVVHTLPRYERSATGRIFSRLTGSEGIPIELTVWFREERPGHAAEFRLRPRPISSIRAATPEDFGTTSLLVVEKEGSDFNLRFLTDGDTEYDHYDGLLSVIKPAHRYGYGQAPTRAAG